MERTCKQCGRGISNQNKNSMCITCFNKSRSGDKNPAWKGDEAGYCALHLRMRPKVPKPQLCSLCSERPAIDLANISQQYKSEITDWVWLCRKCHMRQDGRNGKAWNINRPLSHPILKGAREYNHRAYDKRKEDA